MRDGTIIGLRMVLGLALVAMTGCGGVRPLELPKETTPDPVQSPLPASETDWYVLLNEGPAALDWRLRAIDSAVDSIDFQTFLWHFDTAGSLVLDHLAAAAERGVWVRVLIDDTFLLGEEEALLALHQHPNISYRVYNPFKRRSDNLVARQLLNLGQFHRLDHRMHNKAMVVDNRVAIVGGRNIGDEYFGLDDEANFRDLELMMGGPMVRRASAEFDDYWNDRWSIPIDRIGSIQASPADLEQARGIRRQWLHVHREESSQERRAQWSKVRDGAHRGIGRLIADRPPETAPEEPEDAPVQVADALIDLFDQARSEILIVSAYLIPSPDLEGAVARAVARGVSVRLLTNSIGSNNHLAAHSAYRNHIDELLGAGAELYEVRTDARDRHVYMLTPVGERILALHAKALVFDRERVFIGSANLDPRSLRINTEMGLLVDSPALAGEVRAALGRDLDGANAWRLRLTDQNRIQWVSDAGVLDTQPAVSFMQRIEDWFFAHLPIEGEL